MSVYWIKPSGKVQGAYNEGDAGKNTFVSYTGLKNLIFNPQVQVYYYASRDQSQRIYGRLGFNVDLSDRGNNFPSIQIGYSSDINKFLQFKQ